MNVGKVNGLSPFLLLLYRQEILSAVGGVVKNPQLVVSFVFVVA